MPDVQRVYVLVEQFTGPAGMQVLHSVHSSIEAAEQMVLPQTDVYYIFDTIVDSPAVGKLSKSGRGRAK